MHVLPGRGVLLVSVKTSEAFLCLQPHCPGCTSRSAKRLDWIADSIPSWNDRDTVPLAAHARFVQLEAFAGASTVRPALNRKSPTSRKRSRQDADSQMSRNLLEHECIQSSQVVNVDSLVLRAHWQVCGLLRTKTSTIKIWAPLSHLPTSVIEHWKHCYWANKCAMPHSICAQAQTMVYLDSGWLFTVTKPGWNQNQQHHCHLEVERLVQKAKKAPPGEALADSAGNAPRSYGWIRQNLLKNTYKMGLLDGSVLLARQVLAVLPCP